MHFSAPQNYANSIIYYKLKNNDHNEFYSYYYFIYCLAVSTCIGCTPNQIFCFKIGNSHIIQKHEQSLFFRKLKDCYRGGAGL